MAYTKILMLSFSDHLLQDAYIIFFVSVDNFEKAHKKHAKFWFGMPFPLQPVSIDTYNSTSIKLTQYALFRKFKFMKYT